jgi:hypothetical protein
LYVPRVLQGEGRHDNPARYAAFYLSRRPESVIAEILRFLRLHEVLEADLRSEGRPYGLAAIDDDGIHDLLDLDDPRNLVDRALRPSRVATRNRRVTRRLALGVFEEGVAGFEWWSAIEASWINVTLFADRAVDRLRLVSEPEVLTLDHPAVVAAAEAIGVRLASPPPSRG